MTIMWGPIRLDFLPILWYDVNQFYIGSNGYLKFGSGTTSRRLSPHHPAVAAPNDFLAVYIAIGGSVLPWEQANATIDRRRR